MSGMKNIILVAPHAKSTIDDPKWRDRIALTDYEIWKFGDPLTDKISEFTSAASIHLGPNHRLLCDQNRSPEIEKTFRDEDFFGRPIFKPGQAPTNTEKEELIKKYWWPFHCQVADSVKKLDQENPGKILIIDYHNTAGDHPLNEHHDYMPSMIISNLGQHYHGTRENDEDVISMPGKHMRFLSQAIEAQLPLHVEVNKVYRGGYNTRWFSDLQKEVESEVYTVQIEYNLDYVHNPISRTIDEEALKTMQTALNQAIEMLYDQL
jgi:formiminoglutamase